MKMVFIVGASRSGTTMLNRVLGNHSQILALNELHYFGDTWNPERGDMQIPKVELESMAAILLARHNRGIWGGVPSNEETNQARNIVGSIPVNCQNGKHLFSFVIDSIGGKNNKVIISEQTPRNIFYTQYLLSNYPDAYVIQLIRDPRAVLASQKGRWRRKFWGGANIPWSETIRVWANYHPITMCNMWKKAAKLGLQFVDHPRFKMMSFENIVNNPQKEISDICNFLKINYEAEMSNVPQMGSSNRINVNNAVGISSDVVDAWKNQLSASEIAMCEKLTAPMMERFEYQLTSHKLSILSLAIAYIHFPVHIVGVILTNPKRAWIQFHAYFGKQVS